MGLSRDSVRKEGSKTPVRGHSITPQNIGTVHCPSETAYRAPSALPHSTPWVPEGQTSGSLFYTRDFILWLAITLSLSRPINCCPWNILIRKSRGLF